MDFFSKKTTKIILNSIAPIILGAMLFSCENDIGVVNSLVIDNDQAVESSYDIKMILTDSGKIKLILKSMKSNCKSCWISM